MESLVWFKDSSALLALTKSPLGYPAAVARVMGMLWLLFQSIYQSLHPLPQVTDEADVQVDQPKVQDVGLGDSSAELVTPGSTPSGEGQSQLSYARALPYL